MARKHISAYFLDDREKNEALKIMGPGAELTGAFAFGEVEEAGISQLQSAGLLVQESVPIEAAEPLAPPVTSFGAPIFEVADTGGDAVPAQVDFYTMRLRGPMLESRQAQLDALEAKVVEALPSGGYKVRLSLKQIPSVKALNFVESLTWITPQQSTPRIVTQSVMPEMGVAFGIGEPDSGLKMLTFDLRLHEPEGRPAVEQWLRERNLSISGSAGRKIRFFALENAPELNQLPLLSEVDRIDEYIPPVLSNDVARRLLNIDGPLGHNPATFIAQDGAGQIVAVADTGIDDQHPDFQHRIVGKIARGRPNDTSDTNGHGTHVAGSILGDGSSSNGQFRGVAPKASLFFQSLLDAQGGLGGLPLDLNDLFDEAYQAGARIHNNSWGSVTPSSYVANSEEVDEFIASHPDMLVVIAAGNAGKAAAARKAGKGFVDWLSIGSPGTSKNALTVGACRSSRADSPIGKMTWGTAWASSFPDDPIAKQNVSGDPECLAAFSSRGPCDDRRIKPDLVAPGTDILSTRSSLAPTRNYWGLHSNSSYAFDGGTSMATPLVSGCAALVRQYYVDKRNHAQPSAALLKATLINSTSWLSGVDSTAPDTGMPNYHQGYGRVNMQTAIPNVSDPNLQLQFVDEWQDAAAALTRTGDQRRYQFTLGAATPELRFCLSYTDFPARSLQNNINLIVRFMGGNVRWTGNSSLPDALTQLDTVNNVETVRIQNAQPGDYLIQVVASNILKPPQHFALVVTGAALPALNQI